MLPFKVSPRWARSPQGDRCILTFTSLNDDVALSGCGNSKIPHYILSLSYFSVMLVVHGFKDSRLPDQIRTVPQNKHV